MRKNKILVVGEIIWDVYPDKKTIGGAPLNFAAHSVLCGAESALISAVGRDTLGEEALDALRSFGVDCRYVKKNQQETGQCIVTLDEHAVPHYQVLRDVAYDHIELDEEDLRSIEHEAYDALYFGTLIQREVISCKTLHRLVERCAFQNVLCDVNLRPNCYDRASIEFCLKHATILKVSMEEEPLLRELSEYSPENETPEAIARALCRSYPWLEVVLLTLGKEGSYAYVAKSNQEYRQTAIGEKVVSTVGAGDSFSAAWLTAYLSGASMEACMKKAAEISGFVVAHTQAVPLY